MLTERLRIGLSKVLAVKDSRCTRSAILNLTASETGVPVFNSELYIYWNDNCGSNFEAKMAEIEARLVGMIQAPTRKFTQFRMKNFKNRHSFFGKSFLFFFLLCVKSGFITPPGN